MKLDHTHVSSVTKSDWRVNGYQVPEDPQLHDRANVFAELSEDALYTCTFVDDQTPVIDWISPTFEQFFAQSIQTLNRTDDLLALIVPSDRPLFQHQIALALAGQELSLIHI